MNGRVAVANTKTLTHTFYVAETPTDATGNVAVTVARADGTALTGDAAIAANNGTVGEYDFVLTAAEHTVQLDDLVVTWTATVGGAVVVEVQYVHVVGGRYFHLADLRAMQGIASQTRYKTEDLEWARDVAEEQVERYIETAYARRYAREISDGNGEACMFVGHIPAEVLISATIDGTVSSTTGWTLSEAGFLRTDGSAFFLWAVAGQNVIIEYHWGHTHPPADLARATLRYARHVLLTEETTIPDRARMLQTEIGLFHLDAASEDSPTGLPEVDAILVRYRSTSPASFA